MLLEHGYNLVPKKSLERSHTAGYYVIDPQFEYAIILCVNLSWRREVSARPHAYGKRKCGHS